MYIAHIKNNETGEVRKDINDGQFDDSSFYLWSEGNWSCDCNRALFFARAKGEEDPEGLECTEGKFSVIIELEDGTKEEVDNG